MTTMVYSLKDFETISWTNTFVLPAESIELINNLSNQVASPDYVKTPKFTSNDSRPTYKKNRRHNNEHLKSEDWETIRNFKKTEIIKKEGIEKEIDSIRLLINKLTEKSYTVIIEKICDNLDELTDNKDYDTVCMDRIGYAIFSMATSNKFNSNVYAKLCNTLNNKYEFMVPIISNNISEFMKLFDNMVFVDSTENYDKFCDMNIENERRRSMSLFLTSLYKNDVITLDFVFDNIVNIQTKIMDTKNDESKKMENDEFVENLFTLITNIDSPESSDKWNTVLANINDIKSTKYPGITSKCRFKHMDLIDSINKNKK
jgi:hypothetical protein|tara:strand:- start:761 stop:1708 length:948 start_codon:yes stop_codon:yes gene_type:complete